MTRDIWTNLNDKTIRDYMVSIDVNDDWVCFKDSFYRPESVSGCENRFNRVGQPCYYVASGIDCGKAEVPNWDGRDLYKIRSHTINAFDLPKFARDNGCENEFLASKQDGGYAVCQSLAEHLNGVAVTGILYSSYQMYMQGEAGLCLALLPESGKLVDDTYFIRG